MKNISLTEAKAHLRALGMSIGDWCQIIDDSKGADIDESTIQYPAPSGAYELLVFSQYIAGWLPAGNWKILQVDNSTGLLGPVELSLLSYEMKGRKSFIWEFDGACDKESELEICNKIFYFLMFNLHASLVSSGSCNGQMISIQDGFVYFISNNKIDLDDAKSVIDEFELNPLVSPEWVTNIISDSQ